jgi:hypothetical protein
MSVDVLIAEIVVLPKTGLMSLISLSRITQI